MDTEVINPNGCQTKPLETGDIRKGEDDANREEENEENSLLSPGRGGMSERATKKRQKVQWNDRNGNKLVEVLEFQPSDSSDSDDEDLDSCICTIM